MKISIGIRLFSTTLLALLAAGGIVLAGVRWPFADGAADRVGPHPDAARLTAFAAALAARYEHRHDWSFLPPDAARRRSWLRDELGTTDPAAAGVLLGERLGLVDAQGRLLAGQLAHPLLVALASFDTVEHRLVVDGVTVGALVEARSRDPDDALTLAFLLEQQRHGGVVLAVGIALSLGVAAGLALHFVRPIRRLAAGAAQLQAGHFATRLPTGRSDELGQLAAAFNDLAARLDAAEQARRQWMADTSHELRTPLAVLRAQLEALQDGVRQPTPDGHALMLRQVLALSRLVDDLHDLARADVGALALARAPLAFWPLVEEVARAFADRVDAAGLALALGAAPGDSTVNGDPERLRQVLTNLLENSVRHTAAGGRIELALACHASGITLEISDSAPGVPVDALPRLGDRFFRIEASRLRAAGGTGLGLALCRQIVEAHGGHLAFDPSPLGGLRVRLRLPRAAA